jgi:hypothetical protein
MNLPGKKSILTDIRLFLLEQLTEEICLNSFHCQIEEYNDYLINEAAKSKNDKMALTWYINGRDGNRDRSSL